MLSYDVPSLLAEMGHELWLHSVITGGQGQDDTLEGLLELLENFAVPVVVWLNPFSGRIERDSKRFTDMKVYQDHKQRMAAIVEIPEFNAKRRGMISPSCSRRSGRSARPLLTHPFCS